MPGSRAALGHAVRARGVIGPGQHVFSTRPGHRRGHEIAVRRHHHCGQQPRIATTRSQTRTMSGCACQVPQRLVWGGGRPPAGQESPPGQSTGDPRRGVVVQGNRPTIGRSRRGRAFSKIHAIQRTRAGTKNQNEMRDRAMVVPALVPLRSKVRRHAAERDRRVVRQRVDEAIHAQDEQLHPQPDISGSGSGRLCPPAPPIT